MRQEIAVIKYNAGNIHSVLSALSRLGFNGILTDNPEVIYQSDKVIFPGVGEARSTMNYLKEKGLDEVIKKLTQPVLGICLGMQLLCLHSEEKDTNCLGILPIRVKKFIPQNNENVPHIGWNTLKTFNNLLFDGLKEDSFAYFVHSYYAELSSETIAQYCGFRYCSSVFNGSNIFATQFHPEKSGEKGISIYKNWALMNKFI